MTTRRILGQAVAALSLIMAALSISLWRLGAFDSPWDVAVGSAFLPGAWVLAVVLSSVLNRLIGPRLGGKQQAYSRTALLGIVAGVGTMMAVAFGSVLAHELHLLSREAAYAIGLRGSGVVFGLMVLLLGNALPKVMYPRPGNPTLLGEERAQAFKRFGGWCYVLGALLYIGNWLIVPIPFPALAIGIVIIAVFGIAPAVYGVWLAIKAGPSAR